MELIPKITIDVHLYNAIGYWKFSKKSINK